MQIFIRTNQLSLCTPVEEISVASLSRSYPIALCLTAPWKAYTLLIEFQFKNSMNSRSKNSVYSRSLNSANSRSKNSVNSRSLNSVNSRSKNSVNSKSKNSVNSRSKNSMNPRSQKLMNPRSQNSLNSRSQRGQLLKTSGEFSQGRAKKKDPYKALCASQATQW